jgi:DNA-binding response OmpR family regulator
MTIEDQALFASRPSAGSVACGRLEGNMTNPEQFRDESFKLELAGYRILLVENDPLIAFYLAESLCSLGAEVIGPAYDLESALKLAESDGISAAILDVLLQEKEVWPVARLLAHKGVPFALCTGLEGDLVEDAELADRPTLCKPFRELELRKTLQDMLGHAGSPVPIP